MAFVRLSPAIQRMERSFNVTLKALFIGDIVGRPGREAMERFMPELRQSYDLILANGENAAGGTGMTAEIVRNLLGLGVDVITGGNHTWANRDILTIIDKEERLIRPLNYPAGVEVPGRGMTMCTTHSGVRVGVVNLLGRVFMKPLDCPFRAARRAAESLRDQTPVIFVDIHAEATSEKRALGAYLDGLVSAVIGTHTHVQTSDEIILPGGTAYLTDAGMTGPHDSVIGVETKIILDGFLTGLPAKHKLSNTGVRLEGVAIEVDENSGKAAAIQRVRLFVG